MSKVHKISFAIIAAFLVVAIIFGFITRNSYKYLDIQKAEFYVMSDMTEQVINDLSIEKILSELDTANTAFIVTVKESENIHECTKTIAYVDRVIKGNLSVLNSNIVIYEPNFFHYDKNSEKQYYFFVNCLNNLMQTNKQYLVFANKIEYADSYQNTLDSFEYLVDINLNLYSFPINEEANYIQTNKDVMCFEDVSAFDYICYTENEKNLLNDIRINILNEYL